MSDKSNGRGTFFFSERQSKIRIHGVGNAEVFAKLDSGEIVEYTEMYSEEDLNGSTFLERFPDGVILGTGTIHSIDEIVQKYEKNN